MARPPLSEKPGMARPPLSETPLRTENEPNKTVQAGPEKEEDVAIELQAILTVRAAVFLVVLVLNPRPRGQRSTCDMSNVMQHVFHNSSQLMRKIIAKPFVDIAAV